MKISFVVSPKALSTISEDISLIQNTLEKLGHTNTFSELDSLDPNSFYKADSEKPDKLLSKVEKAMKKADVCIFDVTVPSLGIGHVIFQAISQGKPVVVLYQGDSLPLLLSNLDDPRVQVLEYSSNDDMKALLDDAINYAKDQADTRFNFFISPRHSNYLDWIAKNRRIPRSVYLRNLIKKDMEADSEYQK